MTSDFRPKNGNIALSFMRHASGHNYRNSSFIVDVAMGQISRSTFLVSHMNIHNGKTLSSASNRNAQQYTAQLMCETALKPGRGEQRQKIAGISSSGVLLLNTATAHPQLSRCRDGNRLSDT